MQTLRFLGNKARSVQNITTNHLKKLSLLSSFTKSFINFWQSCSISSALWWTSQPYSARAVRLEQRASVTNHTFDQGSYFNSRSKILEDLETKNSLFNDIDDEQESVSFPGQNLNGLKTPNCRLLWWRPDKEKMREHKKMSMLRLS